jgi:hypothetical protein
MRRLGVGVGTGVTAGLGVGVGVGIGVATGLGVALGAGDGLGEGVCATADFSDGDAAAFTTAGMDAPPPPQPCAKTRSTAST